MEKKTAIISVKLMGAIPTAEFYFSRGQNALDYSALVLTQERALNEDITDAVFIQQRPGSQLITPLRAPKANPCTGAI